MMRRAAVLSTALLLGGCAGASPTVRLAGGGMPEAMCVHCNCLMPAGVDPEVACPVCDCERRAHQCVRGR